MVVMRRINKDGKVSNKVIVDIEIGYESDMPSPEMYMQICMNSTGLQGEVPKPNSTSFGCWSWKFIGAINTNAQEAKEKITEQCDCWYNCGDISYAFIEICEVK